MDLGFSTVGASSLLVAEQSEWRLFSRGCNNRKWHLPATLVLVAPCGSSGTLAPNYSASQLKPTSSLAHSFLHCRQIPHFRFVLFAQSTLPFLIALFVPLSLCLSVWLLTFVFWCQEAGPLPLLNPLQPFY